MMTRYMFCGEVSFNFMKNKNPLELHLKALGRWKKRNIEKRKLFRHCSEKPLFHARTHSNPVLTCTMAHSLSNYLQPILNGKYKCVCVYISTIQLAKCYTSHIRVVVNIEPFKRSEFRYVHLRPNLWLYAYYLVNTQKLHGTRHSRQIWM